MPSYLSDRSFTDHVHQHLALPLIYAQLGWRQLVLLPERALQMDITNGIDYVFEDRFGKIMTVQERFREMKYKAYSDFTIRYRRDANKEASRHESEYYKMKAGCFVYGITNGDKAAPDSLTGFEKFAVVDMAKVYEQLDNRQILIENNGGNFCSLVNNRIICPIKYNRDDSSSFFPIDIGLLARFWPQSIVLQKGFIQ